MDDEPITVAENIGRLAGRYLETATDALRRMHPTLSAEQAIALVVTEIAEINLLALGASNSTGKRSPRRCSPRRRRWRWRRRRLGVAAGQGWFPRPAYAVSQERAKMTNAQDQVSPEPAPVGKRQAHKRGHGEGSIDQMPDGRWRGRLMVGYKPDGKPDRRTVYGKTRAEVQRQLRDLKRQAEQGGLPERHKLTVGEFLDQWLQDCVTRGLKPKTTTNYRQMVRLYLLPAIGKVKLTDLRPEHVRKLCADLTERGLSATTVRYVRHLLHGALRLAVQMELVTRNVAEPVRAPKRRRRELQPPTPEDLAKLLDSANAAGDRLRALWAVGAYTGCRPGELLALMWRDVEWETGTLLIRRNVTAVPGQPLRLQEPKTEHGQRRLQIPPEAVAALKAHRQRQLEERLLLGPDYADQDLIFATHTGGLLHPNNTKREFKEALARAGLPATIRPYDLRHAYATMLFRAGEHPKIVSERLGHASVALALDTYTHHVRGLDADTAGKVQRLIRPEPQDQ